MKIRNNINQSLKLNIEKSIELLGREYKSLNFTIDFYRDRGRLEFERENKPDLKKETYEQILNGEKGISGLTLGSKKQIKIFLFNYGDLETNAYNIVSLIGNIYHEIRHAWQVENNLFQEEDEINTINGNIELYFSQNAEKDAFIFQLENMQKYVNVVLQIFNFKGRIEQYELKPEIMKYINS